jgi:CRP-like cAMP-binding protein
MKQPSTKVTRRPNRNSQEHPLEIVSWEGRALPTQRAGESERKLIQRIREFGREASFEKGKILFEQGQKANGIYLILEGAVKLSVASPEGKALILGFAGTGSMLVVPENVLGTPYEKSATSAVRTTVLFLRRDIFLRLLREDAEIALETAELISQRFLELLQELKTIGLSESALQKLVSFVLGFRPGRMGDGLTIRLPGANQEDLARMIGLSRETTSRLLSRLKAGRILYWAHSTLVIQNLPALEKMSEAGIAQVPKERYKVAAGVF